MNAQYFIDRLKLQRHPEGGYFKETYRSREKIPVDALPERFHGDRNFSTTIYFLLEQGDFSTFHRIKSDEGWHFYEGSTLLIHIIDGDGAYHCIRMGKNLEAGDVLQYVVPATSWFASEPAHDSSFSLAGCTVSPGFDFEDFEMADKNKLSSLFPYHRPIIDRLCR
jgi:uncharacterized protein